MADDRPLEDLTVVELRDKLREMGESPSGSKDDLVERLKEGADKAEPPHKRATKLDAKRRAIHPELDDPGWVAGNPDAAKALGG